MQCNDHAPQHDSVPRYGDEWTDLAARMWATGYTVHAVLLPLDWLQSGNTNGADPAFTDQ